MWPNNVFTQHMCSDPLEEGCYVCDHIRKNREFLLFLQSVQCVCDDTSQVSPRGLCHPCSCYPELKSVVIIEVG